MVFTTYYKEKDTQSVSKLFQYNLFSYVSFSCAFKFRYLQGLLFRSFILNNLAYGKKVQFPPYAEKFMKITIQPKKIQYFYIMCF